MPTFILIDRPEGRNAVRTLWMAVLVAFGLVTVLAACSQTPRGVQNVSTAASLNGKGIAAKDSKEAKEFFQKALVADPYYGPAYNNLGVVLLNEGQYFEAAKALDQAIHLMPSDPEPRIHLGLVYEDAGQYQNALEQYNQALVLAPESIDALQAATRIHVRLEQVDDKTVEHLRLIAVRGTDPTWQAWATRVLIRYGDIAPANTRPER